MPHLDTDNICFFCMAGYDGIAGRNEFPLYQLDNTSYNWAEVNVWQTLSATYVIGIVEDRRNYCVVTFDAAAALTLALPFPVLLAAFLASALSAAPGAGTGIDVRVLRRVHMSVGALRQQLPPAVLPPPLPRSSAPRRRPPPPRPAAASTASSVCPSPSYPLTRRSRRGPSGSATKT